MVKDQTLGSHSDLWDSCYGKEIYDREMRCR